MPVKKVRKRPVEALAILWTGDNADEIMEWASGEFRPIFADGSGYSAEVYDILHDTWIKMRVGDRVIRGTEGEYYPIQPEAFAKIYEEVQ